MEVDSMLGETAKEVNAHLIANASVSIVEHIDRETWRMVFSVPLYPHIRRNLECETA